MIDENVPFLIGLEAISKMGMILDMNRMKLSMGNMSENICQSDSGHIMWESLSLDPEATVRDLGVFLMSEKDQRDKLKKLHIKLGHASEEKMITLLKNTSEFGKEKGWQDELKQVIKDCDICDEMQQRSWKSKMTGLRSCKFNECVAIDLTEWHDESSEKKIFI